MAEISLCMIVKNEEAVLGRCLDSVRALVDEIVIVDTGSHDRTCEIAAFYTDRIFHFPWRDDFAAARNFAFSKGTREYLMWLDADDVIEEDDRVRFAACKASLAPPVDVVMMPYHVAFGGDGRPQLTFARERIVRRACGLQWEGAVHEAITPRGTVVHWDAAVCHRKVGPGEKGRNLRIFERLRREGHVFSPREQYYYGRELADHGRWEDACRQLTAFLDSGGGWAPDVSDARLRLADCLDALGRPDESLEALLQGLKTGGRPPAALCCALGARFLAKGENQAAAFWYMAALGDREPAEGFVSPACYDYIPILQLCLCCDRMGDYAAARRWHQIARARWPKDPSVVHNEAYFNGLE